MPSASLRLNGFPATLLRLNCIPSVILSLAPMMPSNTPPYPLVLDPDTRAQLLNLPNTSIESFPSMLWLFWLLCLILPLIAWYLCRLYQQRILTAPPQPQEMYVQQALVQLKSTFLFDRNIPNFYVGLTDILLKLLEQAAAKPLRTETTEEVIHSLQELLPKNLSNPLSSLLRRADLVKFARLLPDPALCEQDYQLVCRINEAQNNNHKKVDQPID